VSAGQRVRSPKRTARRELRLPPCPAGPRSAVGLIALAAVPLFLAALATLALAGCASWNDRYGHIRTDPVLWFLGGAPSETQLDWPRREVPTLRPLISTDLVAPKAPRPLDYPRGWSPDNPPY